MKPYSYFKQFRTVVFIELFLLFLLIWVPYTFWDTICTGALFDCFQEEKISYANIVLLGFFRPFFLTPLILFSYISGGGFGTFPGILVALMSSILSVPLLYFFGNIIAKAVIKPWLIFNLPSTYKFIHSQDWKIVLICRMIPFFPFDLMSFLFGMFDFRFKYVVLASIVGVLPEIYFFSYIGSINPTNYTLVVFIYIILTLLILIPLVAYEFNARKKGTGLWLRYKLMSKEIKREIIFNHALIRRNHHDPDKLPVLLLYGFFSSRKSLTILERILTYRGYEVISFNLGGLLGVFFTKGIIETAHLIDQKLQHFFELNKCNKVNIVAHSKGGLVAMWWLLKMNGHRHCKKIITMGAPFKGSYWMWLGLVTPLGFIFKDIWQMRPGSNFLKVLNSSKIPEGTRIYNLYSYADKAVRGKNGVFRSTDTIEERVAIELPNVKHYGFLYRREASDNLLKILGSPYLKDH